MDANINRGSSGGPVCNEKGEVVGLTTFGSIENSGGLAAGLNFAIPVSILQEYLDSAGVTARPSETSMLFGDAVVFYDREFYSDALKKFRRWMNSIIIFPAWLIISEIQKNRLHQNEEKKSSMIRVDLLVFGLFLFGAIVLFRYLRKKGFKPTKSYKFFNLISRYPRNSNLP